MERTLTTEVRAHQEDVQEAEQTRAWIAIVLSLLLAEVGMHELGHLPASWAVVLPLVLLAAAGLAGWEIYRHQSVDWVIVTPLLVMIAAAIIVDALGVTILKSLDLSGLAILGTKGPDHGLLGAAHLLSDGAVIGIGSYQLVRWMRLRTKATALGAAAAFTACCGTTAVLLAPAFAALGSALGLAGIHITSPLVVVATIFTAAVAALGLALAKGGGHKEPAETWSPPG